MNSLIGIGDPTASLLFWFWDVQIRKAYYLLISLLFFHLAIVQASSIDSGRCSGLEAIAFKAKRNQLFGNTCCRFFCYSPTPKLLLADMNDSIEKGSAGDNHCFGSDLMTKTSYDSAGFAVFNDEGFDHILVKVYVGSLFQHFPPGGGEEHSVTLGTGAPHGWSLGTIEHSELDHAFVGHYSGISTHGVDLTDDLAFGYTPHCGITAHLGDGLHVHGNEENL